MCKTFWESQSPRHELFLKTTPQTGRALLRDANLVIGKQGEPNLGSRDGVIETPPVSNRQAYVLEVEAEGFVPELTRWTPANQSGTIDIPPVRLRRCVEIRGLVINRRGQPIPNAVVVQSGDGPKRLETHSDQGGQFVLQGVPEGRAAVCVEASGFRYFGTVLQSPSEGIVSNWSVPTNPIPAHSNVTLNYPHNFLKSNGRLPRGN